MKNKAETKKHIEFPHVLVLLTIMVLFASLLTYILPAGVFDVDPETNRIDPTSFHYIENTPVSPVDAFLDMQNGLASQGKVMSLLLILGAMTEVLVSTGAIESLVDTGIHRFKDKSIQVLFPCIYILMAVLGALCGNDSMIAYVAIGLAICEKLHLDRLSAVCLFYLSYITGQAAGPTTAIVLTAQGMLGLEPLSGLGVRVLVWCILTAVGCTFVTRYALRVARDPKNSLMPVEDRFTYTDGETEVKANGSAKIDWRAMLSIVTVVGSYLIYAYGAGNLDWTWNHLTFCLLISGVIIAVLYRYSPNKLARIMFKGACKMGGVCFLIGFAKTISMTLTAGNVIHTIAYAASNLFAGLGAGGAAVALFIFNLLFNFLVPSGTAQAAIVLPMTAPIAETVGMSNQVLALGLQLGDGLTNVLTPLSSVMMGALALAGVKYGTWAKFVVRITLINVLISCVAIFILQTMQWM